MVAKDRHSFDTIAMMLAVMLRWRLREIANSFFRASRARRMLSAGLLLAGVLVFALLTLAFQLAFAMTGDRSGRESLARELIFVLQLLLFAGAAPYVAGAFLLADDLALLLAAPLRPSDVAGAKLVEASLASSSQFAVIGVPSVVALLLSLGPSAATLAVIVPWGACFVLLPSSLAGVVVCAAGLLVGRDRVRHAIHGAQAAVAAILVLVLVSQLRGVQVVSSAAGLRLLASPPSWTQVGPVAWLTEIIVASGLQQWPRIAPHLGALLLVTTACTTACIALGARVATAERPAPVSRPGRSAGPGLSSRISALHGPMSALLSKEWRCAVRDPLLVSQLLMPLSLALVPYLMAAQPAVARSITSGELYMASVAMTALILYMQSSILSMTSIGAEGRAFWIVLGAPIDRSRVLLAKLVVSASAAGAVALAMNGLNALVFRADALDAALASAGLVCAAIALSGIGLGVSAALPRFVYDNPAHRVSPAALIFGFVGSGAYVVVSAAIGALTWVAHAKDASATAALVAGLGVLLLVSASCAALSVGLGSQRLRRMDWEH